MINNSHREVLPSQVFQLGNKMSSRSSIEIPTPRATNHPAMIQSRLASRRIYSSETR